MNSLAKITAIFVVSVALIAFFIYWMAKDYMPKYRWYETYNYQSDQPYGLKLFFDLLSESRNGNFQIIESSSDKILEGKDSTSLYLMVGQSFFIDSVTASKLADFVKRGNSVFISSVYMNHTVLSAITDNSFPLVYEDDYFKNNIIIKGENSDSVFRFHYKIADKIVEREWQGIDSTLFADSLCRIGFTPVTRIDNGFVDCYSINYGKGKFFFHSNPILLTNYNLSKVNGYNYINFIFKGEGNGKVYWDESIKIIRRGMNYPSQSPLRFILSERSLRWSWYLMCFFILLFLVFNSKRKQAAIPLISENRNTTVEYIYAVATLHHQHNSLEILAEERMRQFFSFVRHKYGISSNLERKEFIRRLAPRSGISEDMIKDLYKYYLDVKYLPEVKDMLELYRLTEYFYQNCK